MRDKPTNQCECGRLIVPHSKYLAIFAPNEQGDLIIEVGCAHRTPENLGQAIAITNSTSCAMRWFEGYLSSLKCDHQKLEG